MKATPILSSLSKEQFKSLYGITTEQVHPGYTILMEEGSPSEEMFILTEGVLKVYLRRKEISEIKPISTVGEMGMFTGEVRSATVITMTDSKILRIRKKDLFDLFEKDKDFHIKFQEGMLLDLSHKLRQTSESIARLTPGRE